MTTFICIAVYIIIGICISDFVFKWGKENDPEFHSIVTHPRTMFLILVLIWPLIFIVGVFRR